MELLSSIAFIGCTEIIDNLDELIVDESLIDDMVLSVDSITELSTEDTVVYRCQSDSDSWVNIYEIKNRLDAKLPQDSKYDIIYACTDAKTYIDVISVSGNFDVYLDTDLEKIQELCETYGLEFYGCEDEDDFYSDSDADEEDDYY